ncbi:tetratricopeptide repeat protein [Pelotalea chapellei]|uniref:Tetratricopeptide repeat protein n=1 Tax=Pelotalea chapellei TaxID=44671 RepID=A0ABS5UA35_9BACT|nr:tetratricopeptide repeat protein [Pelotalea chapellei]MBT1072505.1 tetratricopeptide repeat protein [Pelotalea chapellei]
MNRGKGDKKQLLYLSVTVGLICLATYLRALGCGFVNYDDPLYVLNNPVIKQLNWDTVVSAFTQAHVGWWMPLTWISFAIDHFFWGLEPFGYHLTNIVFHSLNAALVVLIADRVLRMGAGKEERELRADGWIHPVTLLLAGLLWGIHPLRVESVAWVTERKDVLNGFFSLGAILWYLCYVQAKEMYGTGARRPYVLSLVFFALSLMAKSVSVVLPLLLLVIDWYPARRLRRDNVLPLVREKLPFLALSVLMALVTVYFTSESNYLISYELFPFHQRMLVSGNAIFEYVRLLLLPVGIIAFYVIPDPIPPSYLVTSVIVAVLCVLIFAFRKYRWISATWLAFIIPLLPVLAILQNGDQSFAARFTYLPSVAPSIAAGAAIGLVFKKAGSRHRVWQSIVIPVLALLVFYVVATVKDIAVWQNSETFWTRIVSVRPGAIVHKERGLYYHSVGKFHEAIGDFSAAIQTAPEAWHPYLYNLYVFRGDSLRAAGRYAEALDDLTAAINQFPHPPYYFLRGSVLKSMGRVKEAEADFGAAGPDPGKLAWLWIAN